MHRTMAEWKQVKPSAVVDGSKMQAANVLAMAIDDILELCRALEAIRDAAEHGDAASGREYARLALMTHDLMQPIRQR